MLITDLPRDLHQRIFANEDVSLRCALACTCRQFWDLSLRCGFWELVDLDVGMLQRKGSPSVAAMIHFLATRISKDTRMNFKCSARLQDPYRLQDADWQRLYIAPLLMGVGITPGLTKLSLNLENLSLAVQIEILDILPWLTALQELKICNICMADANKLNALNKLTQLEKLEIDFHALAAACVQQSPLQGGFPEKLAGMAHLKHLSINRAGSLGILPADIDNLKNLKTLRLSRGSVVPGLPHSFTALTALSSVQLEHAGAGNLASLACLPQLQSLHLSSNNKSVPVELAGCGQLTALTLLLSAVPEHQIEIGFSRMLGFSPLAKEWDPLPPPPNSTAAHLSQNLRRLHIANTTLGSVPQAVTQLPHLQHLSLTHCSLFNLPAGPYISKLSTLVLKCNFFIEIPQSLRGGAAELRNLDLSFNLLKASEADIDTVLQLPKLRHLWVTKTVPQPGPERFRQSLNSWTAYSMDCLFKLAARHAVKNPACPLNLHIFDPPVSETIF